MKRILVMTIALLIAGSLLAQQPPAPKPVTSKPSAFTLSVAITVDAPGTMRWILVDRLTRRLKNIANISYVEKEPDWVIAVAAFDPFPKEKDQKKKQFSMATAFLQQMVWTDPALLESLRKEPCIQPEKIGDYAKTQHFVGNLFTMGVYAGRIDELTSTADDIVDDFVKNVLEPAKKNYEAQGLRRARERSQQPTQLHEVERPKNWPPPLPPSKKP